MATTFFKPVQHALAYTRRFMPGEVATHPQFCHAKSVCVCVLCVTCSLCRPPCGGLLHRAWQDICTPCPLLGSTPPRSHSGPRAAGQNRSPIPEGCSHPATITASGSSDRPVRRKHEVQLGDAIESGEIGIICDICETQVRTTQFLWSCQSGESTILHATSYDVCDTCFSQHALGIASA